MSEEVNDQQQEEVNQNNTATDDLVCGYVVGLKENNDFVFDVVGDNVGLVQLLGLHKYAEHRIEFAKDAQQGYGFPVVMRQLGQLLKAMEMLMQGLSNQNQVAPKE